MFASAGVSAATEGMGEERRERKRERKRLEDKERDRDGGSTLLLNVHVRLFLECSYNHDK